jgi:D-glycero-alpha-D-manno-heptose-7-phosphate kinase
MISKAKAPLRLGLAGGGSDVSPYCELFGGEVVNAAISLYAHTTVRRLDSDMFLFSHGDVWPVRFALNEEIKMPGDQYDLHAGVVNRFLKLFGNFSTGLAIETRVDVPLGSGLGTSSTLIVAMIGALLDFKGITLDKKEIAALACSIERDDLKQVGGKQDQYAACFGGINTLKFLPGGEVSLEPVVTSEAFLDQFQKNLLLFYTNHSRHSSEIIEEQIRHVEKGDSEPLDAMHQLKAQSRLMRLAFEREDYGSIAALIDEGFEYKKKMASGITNERIDSIYAAAKQAGALAGKISGAGGGGFMIFCVSPGTEDNVRKALLNFAGREFHFHFDSIGLTAWRE